MCFDKKNTYILKVYIENFFFFYPGFFSQLFTNHSIAGEEGEHFFNSSPPLPPPLPLALPIPLQSASR